MTGARWVDFECYKDTIGVVGGRRLSKNRKGGKKRRKGGLGFSERVANSKITWRENAPIAAGIGDDS